MDLPENNSLFVKEEVRNQKTMNKLHENFKLKYDTAARKYSEIHDNTSSPFGSIMKPQRANDRINEQKAFEERMAQN